MKKLGSEVVNLNKIVGGFAIAKVMQVVSKVTSGATENFLAQNKALQQYNATVAKFAHCFFINIYTIHYFFIKFIHIFNSCFYYIFF